MVYPSLIKPRRRRCLEPRVKGLSCRWARRTELDVSRLILIAIIVGTLFALSPLRSPEPALDDVVRGARRAADEAGGSLASRLASESVRRFGRPEAGAGGRTVPASGRTGGQP